MGYLMLSILKTLLILDFLFARDSFWLSSLR